MKIAFFILLIIPVFSLPEQLKQGNAIAFIEGLFRGLQFERLAINVTNCENSINNAIKAFKEFIRIMKENPKTYDLLNSGTIALGIVPKITRFCISAPFEIREGIKKIFAIFNNSINAYLLAVLKNMALNPDILIHNVMQMLLNFQAKQYYPAGFSTGVLINFLLNVTKDIPPPPPIMLRSVPSINWDDVFHMLKEITNHAMTTFKYAKIVNETTFTNLNTSLVSIQSTVYNMILQFGHNETFEGILLGFDILGYFNKLWNGIYYTAIQLPEKLGNGTIIQYPSYFLHNLLLHASYIGMHVWNAVVDLSKKDYISGTRRIAIIVKKLLWFDEETLEEIKQKTTIEEIIESGTLIGIKY